MVGQAGRQPVKLTDNLKVAEDRPDVQIEANKHPGSPDLGSPLNVRASPLRNFSQTDQHESDLRGPEAADADTTYDGSIHATVKRSPKEESPLGKLIAQADKAKGPGARQELPRI